MTNPHQTSSRPNGEWSPLLHAAEADEARTSIEEVLAALDTPEWAQLDLSGIAAGNAGLALGYDYLATALDKPDLRKHAEARWDRATDQILERPTAANLYSGFVGVAWVTSILQRSILAEADDDLHHEIEDTLLRFLRGPCQMGHYDVTVGPVGIGVYALERLPSTKAVAILERIVAILEEISEPAETGITWFNPPQALLPHQRDATPNGYYNLGMAHGVPGVVAFLGRVSAAGIEHERTSRLLEGAVEWILSCEGPLQPEGLRFPSWLTPGSAPQPGRVAWCYGDLGLSLGLLLAGRCHRRPDWMDRACVIARSASAVAMDQSGVNDHGICHGAAGIAHVFHRMYRITGDEIFASAARRWFKRLLEMRVSTNSIAGYAAMRSTNDETAPAKMEYGLVPVAGVLTGAMGVAMALAAAISDAEPLWDRFLLASSGDESSSRPRTSP